MEERGVVRGRGMRGGESREVKERNLYWETGSGRERERERGKECKINREKCG